MDVRETTLQELLGGPKQYLVPLYQRPYAWEVKQRNRLWADILELAESRRTNSSATHFMGSLVLSTGAIVPSGVEFLVVDGQQRLTTLSILLCALRDYLRQHQTEQPMLAESIHEQYIADRFKPGDARLKLLPTQADRDSFPLSSTERRVPTRHPAWVARTRSSAERSNSPTTPRTRVTSSASAKQCSRG